MSPLPGVSVTGTSGCSHLPRSRKPGPASSGASFLVTRRARPGAWVAATAFFHLIDPLAQRASPIGSGSAPASPRWPDVGPGRLPPASRQRPSRDWRSLSYRNRRARSTPVSLGAPTSQGALGHGAALGSAVAISALGGACGRWMPCYTTLSASMALRSRTSNGVWAIRRVGLSVPGACPLARGVVDALEKEWAVPVAAPGATRAVLFGSLAARGRPRSHTRKGAGWRANRAVGPSAV